MTRILIYGSLTLGLSILAAGWMTAGYVSAGLALLITIPISLFLVKREYPPVLGLLLALSVFGAAISLWARIDMTFALTTVVCSLVAWDLDGFSRRLACACAEDNPQMIERRHLAQGSLTLLLGVGITLLTQSIHYVFSFEWALFLAFLAFIGTSALVNRMRRADSEKKSPGLTRF